MATEMIQQAKRRSNIYHIVRIDVCQKHASAVAVAAALSQWILKLVVFTDIHHQLVESSRLNADSQLAVAAVVGELAEELRHFDDLFLIAVDYVDVVVSSYFS